jgi:murein DD-endopeptidase MepM/ murein hydrolase activator NlpD
MIGLALSMGASSLLLPRHGDSAVAAEPKPAETSEPALSTLPQLPSDLGDVGDIEGFSSEYAVQPGETLWVISRRYQVTPELLAAVNGLSVSSTLHVGQILRVPSIALDRDSRVASLQPVSEREISSTQPVQASHSQVRQASYYGYSTPDETVAPSSSQESLSSMREKRDRLAASLEQLRLLEPTVSINTDKGADAPSASVQDAESSVNAGDTQVSAVSEPVAADEISTDESSSFAYRYPEEMRGEVAVPSDDANEMTPVVDSVESSTPERVAESSVYQVSFGDTLISIANHYGVSPNVLAAENNIENPDFILLGQLLHIPETDESETLVSIQSPVLEANNLSEPSTVLVLPSVPEAVVVPSSNIVSTPDVATAESSVLVSDASYLVVPESSQSEAVESQLVESQPSAVQAPEQVALSVDHSQTLSNPYVEGLRAEIMALRDRYRSGGQVAEPEASYSQPVVSLSSAPSAPVAVSVESSQPQSLLATTLNVESPVTQSSEESVTSDSTEVAVAPLGYENYDSLVTPMTGRLVSPDLPPLLSADAYLPSSTADFTGYIWPASGMLTSGYGWRWGRMHQGIDIAAPVGTPVVAAAPGVVEYSGWNSGGYGNMVEIRHPDGSMTRYAHNSRNLVQVGDEVEQGQQIAEMGSTGYSTGPHVHFEVHLPDQGTVNPIAYLP